MIEETLIARHQQHEAAPFAPVSEPVYPSLAVRVRGLSKRYRDGTEANCGIDLDVRRGELISILGPNGAGKTTFLRQITTELRPTTGLDPASRQTVWGVIRRAVTEGASVILSTHYMEEAERLSDRIGIIAQGRLIAFGTLDELLTRIELSYRLTYRDRLDPFGSN